MTPHPDAAGQMIPLENYGVRCMSMGFLMKASPPASALTPQVLSLHGVSWTSSRARRTAGGGRQNKGRGWRMRLGRKEEEETLRGIRSSQCLRLAPCPPS